MRGSLEGFLRHFGFTIYRYKEFGKLFTEYYGKKIVCAKVYLF